MKITVKRKPFLDAFNKCLLVTNQKGVISVISNVKLEVGSVSVLSATNMELGVRIVVDCVTSDKPGSVLLGPKVGQILQASDAEEVTLEVGKNEIKINASGKYKLNLIDPSEFPPIAEFSYTKYRKIAAGLFREMVQRTNFAVATEYVNNYTLSGIFLEFKDEHAHMVATSGMQLAIQQCPSTTVDDYDTGEGQIIIPVHFAKGIAKLIGEETGDLHICTDGNNLFIQASNVTISSRLLCGRFPKWRGMIPDAEGERVVLQASQLSSAVNRAAITAGVVTAATFSFAVGLLKVSASEAELGSSDVELICNYNGPGMSVKLDYRQVLSFLRCLEPEQTFTMEVAGERCPVVFKTDDGYTYVTAAIADQ